MMISKSNKKRDFIFVVGLLLFVCISIFFLQQNLSKQRKNGLADYVFEQRVLIDESEDNYQLRIKIVNQGEENSINTISFICYVIKDNIKSNINTGKSTGLVRFESSVSVGKFRLKDIERIFCEIDPGFILEERSKENNQITIEVPK